MSVSKWKWTPECDRGICVGDCDQCDKAVEEVTIKAKLYKKMPDPFVNLKKIEVHDPSIDQLVEEQKTQAEPEFGEWIATSERLPDVHRSVLFATAEYAAEGELMGSYWWQYRWNARLKCEEVIAWMPLPEPYKMQNGKE